MTVKVKEQKSKKIKIAIIILAILLAVSVTALTGTLIVRYFSHPDPVSVEVPGNIITPDGESTPDVHTSSPVENSVHAEVGREAAPAGSSGMQDTSTASVPEQTDLRTDGTASVSATKASVVSLHNRQPDDNIPFQAVNMFPGDRETKYYCIKVSHKGDIIVRYRADVRDGYEKLAEVMKVRIKLLGDNELLYDGLIQDMPQSLNRVLKANESTQSELYYEITAYLDTSVGNEYMDKELIADFRWWVEETDRLDSPQTGDNTNIYLWICLASGSLFFLILLLGKRRKEASDEAE